MSPRARRWLAGAGGVVVAAALGGHLGWFAKPAAWPRATGWDRIPERLRPDAAPERAGEPVIRWLGHSGFSIRWGGTHLLVDPNLSPWCTVSRRVLEPPVRADRLGRVDGVLISHVHFDHFDRGTLRALADVGFVALPAGNEALLAETGQADRARPMVRGDRLVVGDLEIIAVPAAHNSGRWHPLRSPARALGYVIRRGDDALYYAGDTGASNDFESIRDAYHPTVAILPIGAYRPSVPLRRYHLDPEDAVAVARRLGVRRVIPCHFGTFALSLDPPAEALPRFARAAADAGLAWEMPRLLTDAIPAIEVAGALR